MRITMVIEYSFQMIKIRMINDFRILGRIQEEQKKKQVDEAQSNSNNKINMMKKIMKDKNKNES